MTTINKSKHETFDNGVHPVWTTSPGPVSRWWRPLHIMLGNDDDVHGRLFVIARSYTLKQEWLVSPRDIPLTGILTQEGFLSA
jgi:hypothetical protein